MNGKCSINNMNDNLHLIGIIFLSFILIVVIIYFYRNIIQKHCDIVEKYKDDPDDYHANIDNSNNYGEGHNSGRIGTEKTLLEGKITLRPCQVYFVGEEQQEDCDKYLNSTCKYEFTDEWKEIDHITDEQGKPNYYPKKIYNQNYTNINKIINNSETATCFKNFNGVDDINKKFIYQNNDLVKYEFGGNSVSDTLQLQYKNINEDSDYKSGDFISMRF